MTESNKILTVSYGTFSCTLEGFDDPFGTMRGIAEYFRDLAAEDRYFGAEPPTPDVEMLQSIAERDVQRRVEARIGEGGVALRAAEPVEDAELSEPVAAPAEPTEAAPTNAAPDSAPTNTAPEEKIATAEQAPIKKAAAETADLPETAPLAFDDEYLMADEPEDAFSVDVAVPANKAPAPESIAEKLRRIRAVVSRNIDPQKDVAGPFSEAGAFGAPAFSDGQQKRDRALSETIRSISADLGEEDDVDLLDPAEADGDRISDPSEEGEEVSLFVDDVEASGDEDADAIPADVAEDSATAEVEDFSDEEEDEHLTHAFAEEGEENDLTRVEAVSEDFDDSDDTADEMLASVLAATATPVDEPEDDEADEASDADEWDLTELTASEAYGEDPSEEPEEIGAAADIEPSDEDVEAADSDEETAPYSPEQAEEMDAVESSRVTSEKAAHLEPLSETNGNVGRLLKETDEKFADDEGIRRRRVISQMRAAVAATKADRILSHPVSPDQRLREEQSPYRRDLDKVMPEPGSADAAMPKEPAPAPAATPVSAPPPKAPPLVLVSSQRVDDKPAAQPVPVRPQKRVVSEAGTFAAFAEEMGAEELPDLLEAAAAYSAFVEGQPHFSRPEIMKRVARIDPALSLSREAGLRSFGMLLRQGKIRKLQRGQFTIAEDTRFNPTHRIAGE